MSQVARTDHCRELDPALRWALAALSLGAAFVHFAVMGDHFSESAAHGRLLRRHGMAPARLRDGRGAAALARRALVRRTAQPGDHGRVARLAGVGRAVRVPGVGARVGAVPRRPRDGVRSAARRRLSRRDHAATSAHAASRRPWRCRRSARSGASVVILSTLSLVPAVAGTHSHGHGDAARRGGPPHGAPGAAVDSAGAVDPRTGHDHAAGATPAARGSRSRPGTHRASGPARRSRRGRPRVVTGTAARRSPIRSPTWRPRDLLAIAARRGTRPRRWRADAR